MKRRTLTIILTVIMLLMVGCGGESVEVVESAVVQEEVIEPEVVQEEIIEPVAVEPQVIKPVEAEIKTGEDYRNLEKILPGEYVIEGTNATALVKTNADGDGTFAKVTNGETIKSISDPVLVTYDGEIYLYGYTFRRALDRILITETTLKFEEEVIWADLPEGLIKCTEHNFGDATLGEKQNPDGSWHYGIYIDSKEIAGIDLEIHLNFSGDEGIAIDDDGNVYMLYYSYEEIEVFRIPMPEPADPNAYFFIDNLDEGYGFALVSSVNGNEYLIKTRQREALLKNGVQNLNEYPTKLSVTPTYQIVRNIPEKFDNYEIYFGTDAQKFYVMCYMEYDEEYSYAYTYYLDEEIDKHYLGVCMPYEELEKYVVQYVSDYGELIKIVESMNEALKKWEKENMNMVIETITENPWMQEAYPEVAELME